MTWSVRNRLALLAALVLLGTAAGCGDNTPRQYFDGAAGTGTGDGSAGAGGAAGTDAGGDTNSGDAHETGDLTGDKNPDTGEVASGGHDGGAGTDGGGGTGGAGTDGGAGHDGGAGTGGAGTDGGAGTGGAGTGGAGTGGAGTGGAGTGGAGTGGAGTGGAGTGGAGTGGADASADGSAGADGGVDLPPEAPPPPACYSVTFVKPVDQGQLSAADDKDGDQCADGFQYDVVINTSAPNGTSVELFDGAAQLGPPVQASGGTVTFSGVQLASGVNNLAIQFPTTAPCTDATTKAKVTVDCSIPTCSISKPIISPSHPELNGVSTTLGGDRASSDGSPYEVSFVVTTNIADNQIVALDIDNEATPGTITTVTAHALGGTATVAGVPLPGDGTYDVVARCTDGNGVVGRSTKGVYPVDTTPPDLTVSQPSSGAFIGPGGLTAGAFPVCGSTTASDAVNLSAMLGARAANYCVSTTGSPQCTPATVVGANTCVNVPCPGDAPFNITVTISDTAGNPTTTTLTGVTCSSATPTVQIVSPQTDAPTFTIPADHLLAANAGQQLVDLNAGIAGAQTNVVACTSRAGTATLSAGLHGGTLTQVASGIPTAPADAGAGCPAGLGFVVKFMGVTLPESAENATTGVLTTATEFQVAVTDVSSSTGTATEDLWVDSVAPVISIAGPTGICGSFHQAFATFNSDITFSSDTPLVTMTVTGGGGTDTLSSPTFAAGTATFTNVVFDVGQDTLAAVASDPAGNATAVQPVPCTVTVGMAPAVFFTSPMASNELCASTGTNPNCIDDADPLMTGWQGSLTVQALVGGVPTTGNITFSVGGSTIGVTPIDTVTGFATLNGVTFLDGDVKITATTDNIPGNGVGTGSVTVVVDLGPPNPVTNLTAGVFGSPADIVPTRLDRAVRLRWRADRGLPGEVCEGADHVVELRRWDNDDGGAVYGDPIGSCFSGRIAVQNLYIESGYFFAVEAVDAAGNRSGLLATTTPVTAHFITTILSGQGASDNTGYSSDGTGDFGGPTGNTFTNDQLSDLVVGDILGKNVYLYFGASGGYSSTPSVTFTSAVGWFGASVANAGDVDGDGLDDIAIGSPEDGNGKVFIYSRKNPPVSWGTTGSWPAVLTDAQANYVITPDPTTFGGSFFGLPVSRLGNFDHQGADDLAIGAPLFGSGVGSVVIVQGSTSFGSLALPDATKSITISGTTAGGNLGWATMGLSGANTALVTSADAASTVYGFVGTATGPLAAATADDSVVVSPAASDYGYSIGLLGALGTSPAALSIAAAGSQQFVDIHLGADFTTPLQGPKGGTPTPSLRITSPGGNSWGAVNIGGGVPGTSTQVSFIGGDDIPDLVLAGQADPNGNNLYIIDGTVLRGITGTLSLSSPITQAGVVVVKSLPANWNGYGVRSTVIPDLNGDGYGDFAVGETVVGANGRIAVFY